MGGPDRQRPRRPAGLPVPPRPQGTQGDGVRGRGTWSLDLENETEKTSPAPSPEGAVPECTLHGGPPGGSEAELDL